MRKTVKSFIAKSNVKMLSLCAVVALFVSTLAVHQRCWYVMHEEEIPESCKKLQKL